MTGLTTHVLDTAHGVPAAGIAINLYKIEFDTRIKLVSTYTNEDGRCDCPLLSSEDIEVARYELEFNVESDFFKFNKVQNKTLPFLDVICIRFAVDKPDEHYHIPLLVSPYSYSTYRGS